MPPRVQCGNPLWLSWMEELRDQARERGIKSAEAYAKACRSLSVCPVTYHRPRELTVLQGIGDKTAQMLEVKWAAYCRENGLPLPGEVSPRKSKGKAKAHDEDEKSEEETAPVKKRKTAAKKPPKQYIPQKGSGGYGILMALVLAIDRPDQTTMVYLTKSEIIRIAKAYSDSSYEHSEKGTYFTAWNGMKTMVNKGLVYVTGNPHKYCLTEEGYDVALAIRNIRPEFVHLEQHPFVHDGDSPGPSISPAEKPHTPERGKATQKPSRGPLEAAPKTGSAQNKFHFWYIDPAGNRTEKLESAMIRLDHDEFVNLRKIEFLETQRTHPFAKQLRLIDTTIQHNQHPEENSLFAFLLEEGAPPTCSKFPDSDHHSTESVDPKPQPMEVEPASDDFDGIEPVATPLKELKESKSSNGFSRTASAPEGYANPAKMAAEAAARRLSKEGISRTQSSSVLPGPSKHRPGPRLSSHVPVNTPLLEVDEDTSAVNVPDFRPDQAIIFPAGSYDVTLVLDAREVESRNSRDNFAQNIRDKGVNVETRALRLGDILWVAKRRDGLGGEEDECVLDYVCERKRLDDLCISIKDGRYTEQCFRLSSACINHVYYIVEDWDVTNRMQYDGKQIMTAKSQIQVHNRFFLKETSKLSQTIDFLVTMTNVIQASLAHTDLHVIPTRHLSRSTYKSLQTHLRRTDPSITYLTSFEAYQDLNDKNASRTLKVAFGRMLLSVKGMSAERVSAILDIWETPKEMWDALKARTAEAAVEAMESAETQTKGKKKNKVRGPDLFFADTVHGEGRRKIGDALSKELFKALTGGDYVPQAT